MGMELAIWCASIHILFPNVYAQRHSASTVASVALPIDPCGSIGWGATNDRGSTLSPDRALWVPINAHYAACWGL